MSILNFVTNYLCFFFFCFIHRSMLKFFYPVKSLWDSRRAFYKQFFFIFVFSFSPIVSLKHVQSFQDNHSDSYGFFKNNIFFSTPRLIVKFVNNIEINTRAHTRYLFLFFYRVNCSAHRKSGRNYGGTFTKIYFKTTSVRRLDNIWNCIVEKKIVVRV